MINFSCFGIKNYSNLASDSKAFITNFYEMKTCSTIWNGQVMTTLNNFICVDYLIVWLTLSDVNIK